MDTKITIPPTKTLKMKPVIKGLWRVEGAYEGSYDFFAPLPEYSRPKSRRESSPPSTDDGRGAPKR